MTSLIIVIIVFLIIAGVVIYNLYKQLKKQKPQDNTEDGIIWNNLSDNEKSGEN